MKLKPNRDRVKKVGRKITKTNTFLMTFDVDREGDDMKRGAMKFFIESRQCPSLQGNGGTPTLNGVEVFSFSLADSIKQLIDLYPSERERLVEMVMDRINVEP